MSDPCIDPPDRIWDVCTIYRDLIADEEILSNICLNPLAIILLLLDCPLPITYLPDLGGRFFHRLAEGGGSDKDEEK